VSSTADAAALGSSAGPLAALIGTLQAAGGTLAGTAQSPIIRSDEAATGEAGLPAVARAADAGPAAAASSEPVAGPSALDRDVALPAGLFGALVGPVPGAPVERVSEWIPDGPSGQARRASGAGEIGAGEPGPGGESSRDDSGIPAGADQRRRRQEREMVYAVQRRLLEERERMGGLGGLIR
jgi:hypothetical protein